MTYPQSSRPEDVARWLRAVRGGRVVSASDRKVAKAVLAWRKRSMDATAEACFRLKKSLREKGTR